MTPLGYPVARYSVLAGDGYVRVRGIVLQKQRSTVGQLADVSRVPADASERTMIALSSSHRLMELSAPVSHPAGAAYARSGADTSGFDALGYEA
jgi:hypothetical protein